MASVKLEFYSFPESHNVLKFYYDLLCQIVSEFHIQSYYCQINL